MGSTWALLGTFHQRGDLICYSRSVVSDEWPAMARGERSDIVQNWVDTTVVDFAGINPTSAKQEAASSQWFDQQAQRRDGRRESAVVQAVPIAFVTPMVTSAMLMVAFVDHPYADWAGSLQPNEMRVALALIDDGHDAPCDTNGDPR